MNYIDILFIVVIIFGAVRGFYKGVLLELTALVAIALGTYGAVRFSFVVENYIKQHLDFQTDYLGIIAFGLTFLGFVVGVTIIGKTLTKIFSVVGLGFVNRILGGVFGGVKFAIILGVSMLYFLKFNRNMDIIPKTQLDKSISVVLLQEFEPDVLSWFEKSKDKANQIL